MLACRLCLSLGIDDPEQWLEDCPDRVFAVWEAYSQVEPWWGQRELLARIVASLRCLLAGKYESDKVEGVLKNLDTIAAGYMPGDWVDRPEPKPESSIADVEKQLAARFS